MGSILIALALSQCATSLTDQPQNICGQKAALDGLSVWTGVVLRGGAWVVSIDSSPFRVTDSVPSGDTVTPSFYFETYAARAAHAPVLQVRNGGSPVYTVYGDGDVLADRITVGGGVSGSVGVSAYAGRYLVVTGDHPNAYYYPGVHGAVQVQNKSPMRFGYPFEVNNAIDSYGAVTNTHEGHKFLVGARGQLVTYDYTMSGNLPICDGSDNFPPSDEPTNRGSGPFCDDPPLDGGHIKADGGTCWDWYRAVGEPRVPAGTLFLYVADVEESCRCVPRFYDGGLTSSWRKVSDKTECVP